MMVCSPLAEISAMAVNLLMPLYCLALEVAARYLHPALCCSDELHQKQPSSYGCKLTTKKTKTKTRKIYHKFTWYVCLADGAALDLKIGKTVHPISAVTKSLKQQYNCGNFHTTMMQTR